MMKKIRVTLILFAANIVFSGSIMPQEKLLDIMSEELNRNMEKLKKEEVPPYYINYRVEESQLIKVSASFGDLENSEKTINRLLTTCVRVGTLSLDNYHELRDDYSDYFVSNRSLAKFPFVETEDGIKQILWSETNKSYMKAIDRFENVKANVAVKVANEDKAPDFSIEKAESYYEAPVNIDNFNIDIPAWEEKVRKYSKIFLESKYIKEGNVSIEFKVNRKYFVSSEGSKIAQNIFSVRLVIRGTTQADDGMVLPLYKDYYVYKIENLPADEQVMADVKNMVKKLNELRIAPVVDSYTGPVIISASATGVFFHEIFGHRAEGSSLKSEDDAQTFKKKVGQKVLCSDLTVYFDPTIKNYKGFDLNGYYIYDDQGIKGRKVTVIDRGILKGFLMSRTPIDSFPLSNGHGRAASAYQPVTRQSNLIVETSKPYTMEQLRKMLRDEAKKQGKEYGYYFATVEGGFTMTGRVIPNAFNILPLEVYRIYVDGRPDELVRGVDLVGTPLAIFSQIEAAGDTYDIFNGTCGAESGGVPVSSATPAVFVKLMETQKKYKEQDKLPLLPRP